MNYLEADPSKSDPARAATPQRLTFRIPTIKRIGLRISASVVLATLFAHAAWAAAPGSAESVVEKALDALNHGRLDTFVKAMHPDALNEFRATTLEVLDVAAGHGKEARVLEA